MPQKDIDYATRDYEGFRHLMLEKLKEKIPEYTDFSESDFGVVLIELLAMGLDIQSYYLDRVANEVLLNTSTQRSNVIELCNNYGYTLRNATPSIFDQVFEVEAKETGVLIPKGFKLYALDDLETPIYFELKDNLTIPPNCNGLEQDTQGNYLYSVEVEQGEAFNNELLGTSKGTANQTFSIHKTPVIVESIEVLVNEGKGFSKWTQVPNFLNSNPNDTHYSIRVDGDDKITILFGNGRVGKIPTPHDEGIVCNYRVGGGTQGNVTSNTIIHTSDNLTEIKNTRNLGMAKVYGTEKEDIFTAKRNALRGIRTLERAVTLKDFEDVAYLLPFTSQARAEEVSDGRTVNIYILPNTGSELTSHQMEQSNIHYAERKMLGTHPVVLPPKFVPIDLEVKATKSVYDDTDYNKEVRGVLEDYFKLGNFKFKQTLSKANLVRDMITILPKLVDFELNVTLPLSLEFNEILTLGNVQVTVSEVDYE